MKNKKAKKPLGKEAASGAGKSSKTKTIKEGIARARARNSPNGHVKGEVCTQPYRVDFRGVHPDIRKEVKEFFEKFAPVFARYKGLIEGPTAQKDIADLATGLFAATGVGDQRCRQALFQFAREFVNAAILIAEKDPEHTAHVGKILGDAIWDVNAAMLKHGKKMAQYVSHFMWWPFLLSPNTGRGKKPYLYNLSRKLAEETMKGIQLGSANPLFRVECKSPLAKSLLAWLSERHQRNAKEYPFLVDRAKGYAKEWFDDVKKQRGSSTVVEYSKWPEFRGAQSLNEPRQFEDFTMKAFKAILRQCEEALRPPAPF